MGCIKSANCFLVNMGPSHSPTTIRSLASSAAALRKRRWPSCNRSKVPPRTTAPYVFGGESLEFTGESSKVAILTHEFKLGSGFGVVVVRECKESFLISFPLVQNEKSMLKNHRFLYFFWGMKWQINTEKPVPFWLRKLVKKTILRVQWTWTFY